MLHFWCNLQVLMQWSHVDAIFGYWCNIRGFYVMFRCWFIVWAFIHCSGVGAKFESWCNILVYRHVLVCRQFLGADALSQCLCHVRVLMQCLGVAWLFGCSWNVYAVFKCWFNVGVMIQFSRVKVYLLPFCQYCSILHVESSLRLKDFQPFLTPSGWFWGLG